MDGGAFVVSFRNRSNCVDDVSAQFLKLLVALGGYCTASQAQELIASATQVRARLKGLERLGFLRRITKYPVVYQVTKSATRLLGPDSSSRRQHKLPTVQARLLGVHFYLEARKWPAEFVFDHQEKIAIFTDAGCPSSTLPQRSGKPYLREHLLFWMPDWRTGIAMIDIPAPGVLTRLKVFLREFLPLLRHFRTEPDLFIVTTDKGRSHSYERLLKRHRAIHKLGLGELTNRVKTYCVKPPLPSIADLTWPTTEEDSKFRGVNGHDPSHSHVCHKPSHDLIYE
jgi:hypothetical protein